MKTIKVIYKHFLQSVLVSLTFFLLSSCTSEFYTSTTNLEKLNSLKERIYKCADEYGVRVSLNDTLLLKNLDMTDQEIRMRIERLSLISGTYIGKYNSKGNFTLTKLKKNIKRAPSWSPETWQGSASTDTDLSSNAR